MVDAGSCNGRGLGIHAPGNPVCDPKGRGIRFLAGTRHARRARR